MALIGLSTLEDIKHLNSIERAVLPDSSVRIDLDNRLVTYCLNDDKVTALSIDVATDTVFMDDLVALYGAPDALAYILSMEDLRMVFWFKEGIAAEVFVYENDDKNFSRVTSLVFFPYQAKEEFENRWPYNWTCGGVFCGQPFYGIEPTQLNPFNFEDMQLTIIAAPSRTPTSAQTYTFTPTPTATHRP